MLNWSEIDTHDSLFGFWGDHEASDLVKLWLPVRFEVFGAWFAGALASNLQRLFNLVQGVH
jgi:hypothetical protein